MKKRMPMILALVLACVMLFSVLPAAASARRSFPGTRTGTITRAGWIQSLVEIFDMTVAEETAPDNYYSDLTGEEDYYRDILVATSFGVIKQEVGLPFYPEDPADRQFAAQTLNACLSLQLDPDAEYTFAEAQDVAYPDDIQIAINRGWFALKDGAFLPDQAITSAESTAMLADVAEILAQEAVDPNYENVYTYAVDVVEVPEGTEVAVNAENVVTIVNCPVEIKSGDVFVVYFGGIPCPYAAQSVSVEGEKTLIQAAKLETEDVFENVDAQGVQEAEFTQFVAPENSEVTFINAITGESFTDPIEAERSVKRSLETRKTYQLQREIVFKVNVDLGASLSGSVSIKFKDPTIKYKFSLANQTAMVTLQAKYETSLTVEADFTEAFATNKLVIATIGVNGIGGLQFAMVYELKGSASSTYSGSLCVGASYDRRSGLVPIREFRSDSFCLQLELSFKAGFQVSLGINDVPKDILAGYVYFEIGGKGVFLSKTYHDGNQPEECKHLALYLYAEFGAKAKLKFGPVSDEFEYTVSIWDEDNSPVRVVRHYESGVEVPICTRGEMGSNGYFTNAFSNFCSSGWIGGNNGYGLGKDGKPVAIYYYRVEDDGTATITGYSGNANVLYVPGTIDGYTVTGIADHAFSGQKGIVSVTVPDSITWIGQRAFESCTSLRTVRLPEDQMYFGCGAFIDCTALEEINLPKEITLQDYTGSSAYPGPFSDCSSLKYVSFAEGTTYIRGSLFWNCTGLREIEIPETVTTIESSAFSWCTNLTSVTIPQSVTRIDGYAFNGCQMLDHVVLPDNLAVLGCGAFRDCTSLSAINIPLKMKTGDYCGDNYQYPGPFSGCASLKTVNFAEGYTEVPNALFYGCNGLETIALPNTVTRLCFRAFYNCENLKSVDLPDSLVEISNGCFQHCTSLEAAALPRSLAFLDCVAFGDCTALTTVYIPKSMETNGYAGNNAYDGPFFNCSALCNVAFEEGITRIPRALFEGCTGLREVTIPETVKRINFRAFALASGMTKITLPENLTAIETRAFAGCEALKEITIPNQVSEIGDALFINCYSMEKAVLSDGMTFIPSECFHNCYALKDITIDENITEVRKYSFQNCTSLEQITIPGTVEYLGSSAFNGCTSLKEVQLDLGLEEIWYDAFNGCSSLEAIVIPDSVTVLEDSAFANCDKLSSVTIGYGIQTIPDSCFLECPALKKIELPYSVRTIESKAFANCTNLTEITILQAAEELDESAFSYPTRLTIYGVSGSPAETYAGTIGAAFVPINIPATEVSLSETELLLNAHEAHRLYPVITPRIFTDAVTWKTSNSDIAKVTDGLIEAGSTPGTATVSLIVGNRKVTCKVTVVRRIESIVVNPYSVTLDSGETHQFTATYYPSNAYEPDIVWSSDNESVATVDQNGLVTAVSAGTAKIFAKSVHSEAYGSSTVTVNKGPNVVTKVEDLQSEHPYANGMDEIWIYTVSGAKSLAVTFSDDTSVEEDSDYIYIYTGDDTLVGKYTGSELAGQTVNVTGETVKIRLVSDSAYAEYGFRVVSVVPTMEAVNPFVDVKPGKYYYNAVMWAINHDPQITKGTDDTHFSPNKTCNRGQVVTFLWNAKGKPEPDTGDNPFVDVKPSKYYYKAVLWAYQTGVTKGADDTHFNPNGTCTRAQVVSFLWNALGKPEPDESDNPFVDVKPSKFYYKPVLWAYQNGVTKGSDATHFSPNATCTRGQVVTFLYNAGIE